MENESNLRGLVNASGFLLQLAIEQAVRDSKHVGKWRVTAREIPWFDELTKTECFADLMLQRGPLRLLVECKRPRNADWVFLVSPRAMPSTEAVRSLWVQYHPSTGKRAVTSDVRISPECPESEFCVVRGGGEKQVPMLERVAAKLVRAADFLATQELRHIRAKQTEDVRAFIPVIVTTARLSVCRLNPGEVSLLDGELDGGLFEDVPAVRFRKSLAGAAAASQEPRSIRAHVDETLRTVLVMNAEQFVRQIDSWKTLARETDQPWYVGPASE